MASLVLKFACLLGLKLEPSAVEIFDKIVNGKRLYWCLSDEQVVISKIDNNTEFEDRKGDAIELFQSILRTFSVTKD